MFKTICIAVFLSLQLSGCFFFYVRTNPSQGSGQDSPPVMNQQNLTACRDWDRANRKGTFSEEQAEKRKLVELNLNEADCKSMIAVADR